MAHVERRLAGRRRPHARCVEASTTSTHRVERPARRRRRPAHLGSADADADRQHRRGQALRVRRVALRSSSTRPERVPCPPPVSDSAVRVEDRHRRPLLQQQAHRHQERPGRARRGRARQHHAAHEPARRVHRRSGADPVRRVLARVHAARGERGGKPRLQVPHRAEDRARRERGRCALGLEIPWTFAIAMRPGVLGTIGRTASASRSVSTAGTRGAHRPLRNRRQGRLRALTRSSRSRIVSSSGTTATFLLGGGNSPGSRAVGVPVFRGIVAIGWTPRPSRSGRGRREGRLRRLPGHPRDLDGFRDSDRCPDIGNDQDGIIVAGRLPRREGRRFCRSEEERLPEHRAAAPAARRGRRRRQCRRPKGQVPPGAGTRTASGRGRLPDPDNGGDGIRDKDDACPNVKGEASTDPPERLPESGSRRRHVRQTTRTSAPTQRRGLQRRRRQRRLPRREASRSSSSTKTPKVTLATPIKLERHEELPRSTRRAFRRYARSRRH